MRCILNWVQKSLVLSLKLNFDDNQSRLPSTLLAAHWSGMRPSPADFLHEGKDCKLPWLTIFFMSLVVLVILTPSPQSCRGILPTRLGNQPVNLLSQDPVMQLLLCHRQLSTYPAWICEMPVAWSYIFLHLWQNQLCCIFWNKNDWIRVVSIWKNRYIR